MESDVRVRHCDQTRHYDVRGGASDKNGLQVTCVAVAEAASLEEGLRRVWMQTETGSC